MSARTAGRGFVACLPVLLLSVCSLQAATNLVVNGDLEHADPTDPGQPLAWDKPDGKGICWDRVAGDGSRGKSIRMNTSVSEKVMVASWKAAGFSQWDIPDPSSGPVAATYGLSYYSASMPVTSGQAYRVSFEFKGPRQGTGAKLWVRCYGMFRGEMRRRYEKVVTCRVPDGEWHRFSEVLHPSLHRPRVTEMKVMLYAYWPPGEYWFDNIAIEPVDDTEYERDK